MMQHKGLVLILAAVVAGGLAPARATGQAGGIWLEPRAGWLMPTRDLGRTDILDNSGYGVFEQTDPSAMVGLGVGVDLGTRWAIRGSVDRSFRAAVEGEWQCVPFVACPAVLLPVAGDLTRWTTSVDVLYRPVTPLPLHPMLFAGVGVRRSELSWGAPEADVTLPAFSFNETRAVVRAGLGLERSVGPARLFGQVEATSSRFGGGAYESVEGNVDADRTRSIDVGVMGGLRVRLH